MTLDEALIGARALDEADELAPFRERFHFPTDDSGRPQLYFCGNSLGLQPKSTSDYVNAELEAWRRHAVDGHFRGERPWMPYHEFARDNLAELVGALPHEVVAMNTLTTNLHLMMVSFYRPRGERRRIVIERQAFPSDRYAVESQIRFHGLDPADALVELEDAPGSASVSLDTLEQYLDREGDTVALVLMPGVQYLSGQLQDMAGVCELGRRHGCAVGLDLAHAAGNARLALHEWGPDFAVWCSYKYLNAGPGAVAGCFVHERHAERPDLPRFAGWWGHDRETRFRMGPHFKPSRGADGWQLSNPPIMALAPLLASLEIFHDAGMARLRARSKRLTSHLAALIDEHLAGSVRILTPADPDRRGCQLSLQLLHGREHGRAVFEALQRNGVIGDWREPDVIRVAPTPLYNSFEDVVQLVAALHAAARP